MLELEIFQGLEPLQITEIARRAYRVVYKPGDIIPAGGRGRQRSGHYRVRGGHANRRLWAFGTRRAIPEVSSVLVCAV